MDGVSIAEDALRARPRTNSEISVEQAFSSLALLVDAFLIVCVSLASGIVVHQINYGVAGDLQAFAATGAIVAVLFCGMLRIQSTQSRRLDLSGGGRVRNAIVLWSLVFLFLLVTAFAMKISSVFSRGTIFTFYFSGMITISASRLITPRVLARWSLTNAYRSTEMLIVAPEGDAAAARLRATLADQGCPAIRTILFDDSKTEPAAWAVERKRLVGAIFDTARAAAQGDIYICGGGLPLESVSSILGALRIVPRAVYLVADDQLSWLLQNGVKPVGSAAALEIQKSPLGRPQRAAKRAFDMVASAVGLIFLAPLLLLIAIAIKLNSPGPVLFRQTRNGYRGHPFRILKFRSMRVQEDGATVAQATRNDSRVTRVGAWLRKTSLDELPQLWNVLRGDMSIIGPRPHAAAHDTLYRELIENYEVRQHVRPGITGWAQVNGMRGETAQLDLMYRRIEMDIWYATNCSLPLDLEILFRTVFEVMRQRNAY